MDSSSNFERAPDDNEAESSASNAEDEATRDAPTGSDSLVSLLTGDATSATTAERQRVLEYCKRKCLNGKAAEVQRLLNNLRAISKEEHRTSIFTAIAMCAAFDNRQGATKQRERYTYYAPFIGSVCKTAFESLYGVSHRTLHLYRTRVREGDIAMKTHGGVDNTITKEIDEEITVQWFVGVSDEIGDVVPVRVRLKEVKPGISRRYYSHEDHTLLPSYLT